MNYKYIVSLISNKSIIAIFSLMLVVSYLAYQRGLQHGFIPKEKLCMTEIMTVDQCNNDLIQLQKEHTKSMIECNSNCKIDTCKPICTKQTTKALDNYKKLTKELKCGDLK